MFCPHSNAECFGPPPPVIHSVLYRFIHAVVVVVGAVKPPAVWIFFAFRFGRTYTHVILERPSHGDSTLLEVGRWVFFAFTVSQLVGTTRRRHMHEGVFGVLRSHSRICRPPVYFQGVNAARTKPEGLFYYPTKTRTSTT